MAAYMKDSFGDDLLSDFIDGNSAPSILPSLAVSAPVRPLLVN